MKKREVVLFGAGTYLKNNISVIESYFDILFVCDNDEKRWGTYFDDKYKICSLDDMSNDLLNIEFLVTLNSKKMFDEVVLQLKKRDINCRHVNDAIFEECIKKNSTFYLSEEGLAETKKIETSTKKIFVLTSPPHSNLGDQAQTMCTRRMLENKYHGIIFIYDQDFVLRNYFEILYIIKQHLTSDDMIFLHSGYRLTDLYMDSLYATEMMVDLFENKKMVFLPQTIHFMNDDVKDYFSNIIGNNITILCRDKESLKLAQNIFDKAKNVLYPDLVTSLIGKYNYTHKREGVLFCLRTASDGESLLCDEKAIELKREIEKKEKVTFTDTTIEEPVGLIINNRKYYIEREIDYYSKFKVVVTNRFHGMVFALAANTPVIAMPTSDHKITATVSWFVEAGFKDVFMCSSMDEIVRKINFIISNYHSSNNTDYFYEKFFKDFDPWNI